MTTRAMEKICKWMTAKGYATGHGDTIEDLLNEIDGQAREAALRRPEHKDGDPCPCCKRPYSNGDTCHAGMGGCPMGGDW